MRLRLLTLYGGDTCTLCGAAIPARSRAWSEDQSRSVVCVICEPVRFGDPLPPPEVERSTSASPSAREHPRQSDEVESRSGAGVLGRVMRLLADGPATTTAHPNVVVRERRLGRLLDTELVDSVRLHDLTVPTTQCQLDHLVIASSGIWLIDAKRSAGEVECRSTGAFASRDLRLFVNGRNQTELVHAMGWQVAAVRSQLERIGFGELPVRPVVCFTSSRWAPATSPFEVHGVLVTWPSALVEMIGAPGPIDPRLIDLVAGHLSSSLSARGPSGSRSR